MYVCVCAYNMLLRILVTSIHLQCFSYLHKCLFHPSCALCNAAARKGDTTVTTAALADIFAASGPWCKLAHVKFFLVTEHCGQPRRSQPLWTQRELLKERSASKRAVALSRLPAGLRQFWLHRGSSSENGLILKPPPKKQAALKLNRFLPFTVCLSLPHKMKHWWTWSIPVVAWISPYEVKEAVVRKTNKGVQEAHLCV